MLRRSTQNLLCALGFVGGIALRSWMDVPLVGGYAIACVGAVVAVLGWRHARIRVAGIAAVFLFLGLWRTDIALRPPLQSDISHFSGQTAAVEGVVARDPDVRLKTQKVVVEVDEITHSLTPPKRGIDLIPHPAVSAAGYHQDGDTEGAEPLGSPTEACPVVRYKLNEVVSERGLDDWSSAIKEGRDVREVNGKLLVIVPALYTLEVGDEVRLQCEIERPEPIEDFDYPRYLAKDGIYAVCNYPDILSSASGTTHSVRWALARLKRDFQNSLNHVVPDPEGAFLGGILVGSRGRIPEAILEDFQRIGITHLIAISGYNITIIATGVLALLTLFLRRHTAFPALALIIAGFTMLVGGSASVVRAAIMGIMLHAAYVSDRLYRPAYGLTLAAAAMLAFNPRLLRDDLGFDLSFLATVGIVWLGPWFTQRFHRVTNRWHIREALAMTCAAQVTTLPLLVGSFDRVSLISPLANMLIVPMIPLVMLFGFTAGITGVLPGIGFLAGNAAWFASFIVLQLAHLLAQVPAAYITVPSWAWVIIVVLYALVLLGVWQKERVREWFGRARKLLRRSPSIIQSRDGIRAREVETAEILLEAAHPPSYFPLSRGGGTDTNIPLPSKGEGGSEGVWRDLRKWIQNHKMLAVAMAAVMMFAVVTIPPYLRWNQFSVTVFDIGQGDAILINAPHGQQMLIDGGPDATILSKLGRTLPWWDRTIEYVVLTHPHADHVAGLVEVLQRYRVKHVLMTGALYATEEYRVFLASAAQEGIAQEFPTAGTNLSLGNAHAKVLFPMASLQGQEQKDINETSLALEITYQGARFLFMGDGGVEEEDELIARYGEALDSDVLKVGHHGSATASGEEFLSAVTPRYAAISVGAGNRYGHPSPRVVKRLERAGAQVIRTDEYGDIKFVVLNGTEYFPIKE